MATRVCEVCGGPLHEDARRTARYCVAGGACQRFAEAVAAVNRLADQLPGVGGRRLPEMQRTLNAARERVRSRVKRSRL